MVGGMSYFSSLSVVFKGRGREHHSLAGSLAPFHRGVGVRGLLR
jgi:hypothetical protein